MSSFKGTPGIVVYRHGQIQIVVKGKPRYDKVVWMRGSERRILQSFSKKKNIETPAKICPCIFRYIWWCDLYTTLLSVRVHLATSLSSILVACRSMPTRYITRCRARHRQVPTSTKYSARRKCRPLSEPVPYSRTLLQSTRMFVTHLYLLDCVVFDSQSKFPCLTWFNPRALTWPNYLWFIKMSMVFTVLYYVVFQNITTLQI